MIVVFLGAPGSGKGTQAGRLAERSGVPQISTGDILRRAVAEGTPLGSQAKAIMERGDLVPDDVIIGLIRERTAAADCRDGFLLDGFPRTIAQAEALERLLQERGWKIDAAISLDVDEEKLLKRMAGRAAAEGRADDAPETVRERLRVYDQKTAPLRDWYAQRGSLRPLDGVGTLDEVSGRIDAALAGVPAA